MSGTQGVAATRMNLLRSQKRLARVEKGYRPPASQTRGSCHRVVQLGPTRGGCTGPHWQSGRRRLPASLSCSCAAGIWSVRPWVGRPAGRWKSARVRCGASRFRISRRVRHWRTLGAAAPPASVNLATAEAARQFEVFTDLLLDAAPRGDADTQVGGGVGANLTPGEQSRSPGGT